MKVASSRRRLIVVILLTLAVGGAVIRHLAPAGSLPYDIGTLLLVMWVPAVGNIIGYLMGRWSASRGRSAAYPLPPFAPHIRAALQWAAAPPAPGEHGCIVIVDSQGFTARAVVPTEEGEGVIEIEFLVPQAALPHFPADAPFSLVQGRSVIGRGKVLGTSRVV
jgi:hypothetical protein